MSDDLFTLTTRHGTLYRHNDTEILIADDGIWVTIGTLDGMASLIVDQPEWAAFVEMVNAIDAKRKEQEVE